jgi:hypothetical protein
MLGTEHPLKRIFLAAVGVAVAGLTACSNTAAPTSAPAGTSTSHGTVRTPVSCNQQYHTWQHGPGKGLIAALSAVSSAERAGDAQVLTVRLKQARPTVARAAHHPVPACADPRGYWDVLLMHVSAAAATKQSVSSVRAAMKDVPAIEHRLTAELKQTAHSH